jgi:O-antigen ligase
MWMLQNSAAYRGRIDRKIGNVGLVADFARENIEAGLRAFTTHPLVGAGVGGIAGVYSERYEVHSTYLGVPAQTGIVGTLAYLWFMIVFLRSCTRTRNDDGRAWLMGRLYLPLLLGLCVSFGYTYHLRKREFWITAAIASAVMAPAAAGRGEGAPGPRRGVKSPGRVAPVPQAASSSAFAGLPDASL